MENKEWHKPSPEWEAENTKRINDYMAEKLATPAPVSNSDALREQAEKNVLRVRGSYDAPGFDACVQAEMKALAQHTEEGV